MQSSSQQALLDSLKNLREQKGEKISISDVGSIIESLLTTLQGDVTPTDMVIHQELEEIAARIEQAKREVNGMVPGQKSDKIPEANMELDAVVKATEEATNTILDNADEIMALLDSLDPEVSGAITEKVTKIFEACNFQDITGQRISKVVNTLNFIEEKIIRLNRILSDHEDDCSMHEAIDEEPRVSQNGNEARPDEHLMNGPQLNENAPTQAEIDALLASLD